MDNILENNKLIAKFMGWNENKFYCMDTHRDNPLNWFNKNEKTGHCFNKCSCKNNSTIFHYHWSWDWLMPVVEKIESLGYFVKISTKMSAISRDNKGNSDSYLVKAVFGDDNKLKKTYDCVVSAIKYINYKNK